MRTFLAAVSMLSALPLGRFCPTETELRRSLNLFPAAGLLFGALFYGIGWCLAGYCAPLPAAMLLALLPEALTKGLHLDGLADTADGFLSGRSPGAEARDHARQPGPARWASRRSSRCSA